jgi:hypothetical protein
MALTIHTPYGHIPAAVSDTTTNNPISGSYSCGVNTKAVVAMLFYAAATQRTGGTPTYGGENMLQAESLAGVTEAVCEMWYLINPPTGQQTISIPNANTRTAWVNIVGVNATSGCSVTVDDTGINETTAANPTVQLVTTTAAFLAFACVATGDNTFNPTAQRGTEIYNDDPATYGSASQYLSGSASGTVNMFFTEATSDDYGALAIAFKEALGLSKITVANATQAQTAGNTTLTYNAETPPTTTLGTPNEGYSTSASTVDLKFTGVDSSNHRLDYEVQVDTSNTFTPTLQVDQVCPADEWSTGSPYSITFPTSPTPGALVVVGIGGWDGANPVMGNVEDNQGNTYYEVRQTISGAVSAGIYYAKNVTSSGTFIITASPVLADADIAMGAVSYIGVDKTSPLSGSPNGNTGTSDTPTTGSTVAVGDAVYFAVFGWAASTRGQPVEPWIERLAGELPVVAAPIFAEDQITSGEQTASCTIASAAWAGTIAAFKSGSPLIDAFSTDHTGFSAGASHPTNSGVEQTYTIQVPLSNGTYYWRARATDNTTDGAYAGYGGWSGSKTFIIAGTISLTIQNATQAQTAQKLILQPRNIYLNNATQAQTSDKITLSGHYVLSSVKDSTQAQTSDKVLLAVHQIIVNDGTQLQAAYVSISTFTDGYGGDVSTSIDTYIHANNPDTNYGTSDYLVSSIYTPGWEQYSFLRFSLTSLAGRTIKTAVLSLYQSTAGGVNPYTADFHRIKVANNSWTEAGATWNHTDGSNHWAGDTGNNGGSDAGCSVSGTDYETAVLGVLYGLGTGYSGNEYPVSLDLAEFQNLIYNNYGIILRYTSSDNSSCVLYSSDYATTSLRPKLVVQYYEQVVLTYHEEAGFQTRVNGARDFNGTTDRVDWSSKGNLTTAPLTISAWINWDAINASGNSYIFGMGDASDGPAIGFNVQTLDANTGIGFFRNGSSALYRMSNASHLSTGTWIHVLVTHDGTFGDYNTAHIYKDGTEVTYYSSGNGSSETTASGKWTVGGRYSDDTRNFNGRIGEVAVWDRVLNSTEIAQVSSGSTLTSGANILNGLRFVVHPDEPKDLLGGTIGTLDGTSLELGPDLDFPNYSLTVADAAHTLTGVSDAVIQPINVDFEEGNFDDYDGTYTDGGYMSVAAGAAYAGNYGQKNEVHGTETAQYGFKSTGGNQTRVRNRFYFNCENFTLQTWAVDTIWSMYGYGGVLQCRISLQNNDGSYDLISRCRDDAATELDAQSSPTGLHTGWHYIEVDWKASSSVGANDGFMRVWVDNTLYSDITGVDNDTRYITSIIVGFYGGPNTDDTGYLYYDEIAANTDGTPIGAYTSTGPIVLTTHNPSGALIVNNASQLQTAEEITFLDLRTNGSRHITASSDKISFSSIDTLTGDPLTISAWIYLDTNSASNYYIVGMQDSGDTQYGIVLNLIATTTLLDFVRHATSDYLWNISENVPGIGWRHVLLTSNGGLLSSSVAMYVDGVSKAVSFTNGSGAETAHSGKWTIGGRTYDNARYFDGKIAEVAVWNRVLDSTEIAIMANRANLKSGAYIPNGLIFLFHPDEPKDIITGATATVVGTELYEGPNVKFPRATPNNAAQAQTSDNVTITYHEGIITLTVQNATQAQTSDKVTLSAHYVLSSVKDATQAQTSDKITLSAHYALSSVKDATQAQTSDKVILQPRNIYLRDATQAQTSDKVTLSAHYVLSSVKDATQAQTSDKVLLVVHQIIINNATQTQTSDKVTLSAHYALSSVKDATQAQTSDKIILQPRNIYLRDSTQAQTSDKIILQPRNIYLRDATQAQTSDKIILQPRNIYLRDSTQAQTSDKIILQPRNIYLRDATQAQTSDKVLLVAHQVVINNANQTQTSDKITLSAHYALSSVKDSTQAQTSNKIILQPRNIYLHDATQAQTSDNVVSSASYSITVQNATHAQIVGFIGTFTDGYGGNINSAYDNTLSFEYQDTNNGVNTVLAYNVGAYELRNLLKFDISSLVEQTITEATLFLTPVSDASWEASTIYFHMILSGNSAWTEMGSCWNYQVGTTPWAGSEGCKTSGTDYYASEAGHLSFTSNQVVTGVEQAVSLDIAQIQAWANGTYFGIVSWMENGYIYIASSDNATTSYRPKLTVQYIGALSLTQHYIFTIHDATQIQKTGIFGTFVDGYGGDIFTAKDNTMSAQVPTWNYGNGANLRVGRDNGISETWRTLIQFTLSSLPDNSIIDSAVLSLYINLDASNVTRTYRIFRLKRAWEEGTTYAAPGTSNWNEYSSGNSWSTPGAFGADDCEQTDIGSRQFSTGESGTITFSLTPTTKTGLDLGYGWLIKADTEDDDCYRFNGAENVDTANLPKLTVTYRTNVYLTQHQSLTVQNATQAQTSDKITLIYAGYYNLTVQNATQAQTSDKVTLNAHYILSSVKDAVQAQTSDKIILQPRNIYLRDATQAQTSDKATLSAYYTLSSVKDATQAQTSDKVLLVVHQIIVNNATQTIFSDKVTLSAHYVLSSVKDASQAQTSDKVLLVVHQIVVNNATQATTSDKVSLSAHYAIVVSSATQTQTSDNVALTQHQVLGVNNSTQIMISDKVNLSAHYSITVANTTQIQTADKVTLIIRYTLTIQNSVHVHTADGNTITFTEIEDIVLIVNYVIGIQNSTQIQASENIALIQHQVLGVNDSTQAITSNNISLTQHHILSVNNTIQIQTSDKVDLIFHFAGVLVIQNSTQAQTSDNIALIQHQVLSIGNSTQTQTSDNLILYAHYSILVNNSAQAQVSDNVILFAHYAIIVNNSTQIHTADNVVLFAHYSLTVNNTTQIQTSDNISLTQHQVLVVNNSAQTQISENIILFAHYSLTVNNTTHVQISDNILLTQHHILGINNATQTQISEKVVLFAHYALTINNATQSQTSENVALTQHYVLGVNNSTQLHTSDNIVLFAHYSITVNNTTQAQTSENVVLIQHYVLGVNGSTHVITSDNVVLFAHYTIVVNSATQVQTSENAVLFAHYTLTVNNSTQTQTSYNITLFAHYSLTVQDTTQSQTSDKITLFAHYALTVNNAIQLQIISYSWWITEGITNSNVAGVYQPKGAGSYALSKVNLANPGTHDAIDDGVHSPDWDAINGWIGSLSPGKYLRSDIVLNADQTDSVFVRYSDYNQDSSAIVGSYYSGPLEHVFTIGKFDGFILGNYINYYNGNNTGLNINGGIITGVVGVSGNKAYKNNVEQPGNIPPGNGIESCPPNLLGFNNHNSTFTGGNVKIQAEVWYNIVLTPQQVFAITNGMNSLGDIILSAHSTLTVDNATQAQTADNVSLLAHYTLTINNATQAQTSDNVGLLAHYTITVNDSTQSQISDTITLSPHNIYALVVNDSIQNQTAEKVDLVAHMYGLLVIQTAVQGQTADKITLTATIPHYILHIIGSYESLLMQDGWYILAENGDKLALDDSTAKIILLHTADNIILFAHYAITINNSTQAQTSDNISLTQHYVLTINNATQGQNSDNVGLTQHYVLTINNATQSQTSESVVLSAHYSIVVNDGIQLQNSDKVNLFAHYTLTIQNTSQLQTSENIALLAHYALTVNNATQLQTSDKISLFAHYSLSVNNATQLQIVIILWWLPDGVNPNNVYNAYQPKGAASYIKSKINLAHPGTRDANAPFGDPSWDVVNGWYFSSVANKYLETFAVPENDQSWSVIVKYSNAADDEGWILGVDGWDSNKGFGFIPRHLMQGPRGVRYYNGGYQQNSFGDDLTHEGIIAVSGNSGYKNGVLELINIPSWGAINNNSIFIGCVNKDWTPYSPYTGYIQAVAIYDIVLTSTQVLAITNAMNNLEDLVLSSHYSLVTVNNATQVQTADNVSLLAHYTLTINNATQSQTSDNVTITGHIPTYNLVVDNSTQSQTSDTLVLAAHYSIVVNDVTQAQTSDSVTLAAHYTITINNAVQSQTSEKVELTQHYNYTLSINDSTQAQTSDSVILSAHYTLTINDAAQTQTSENIILSPHNIYALTVNDVTQTITSGNIILIYQGYYNITVVDSTQAQTSENTSLTQHHVLTVSNSAQVQTSDIILLLAHYAIIVNNTVQTQTSDIVVLLAHYVLTVNNVTQAQTSDNVVLFAHYSLTVNNATQSQTSDNITITGHIPTYSLAIENATQSQNSDNVILLAHYTVIVNNSTQSQISDNVILSAHYTITINNATQLQNSDNVSLSAHYALTINNGIQVQTSENIVLSPHNIYALIINDAIQGQTSDEITLIAYMYGILTIQSNTQGQTSENILLTQHYGLFVNDSTQLQASDNIILFAHYSITINNSTQAQTSDNITLLAHYSIVVNDTTQTQASENVVLFAHYILVTNNSSQYQIADNIILTQHQALVVNDSVQGQTSDIVVLTQHQVLVINDSIQTQTAENTTLVVHMLGLLVVQNTTQGQTADNITLTAYVPNFTLTANLTLSNAGLTSVNGEYMDSGKLNGREYYKLVTDNDIRVWWNGSIWVVGKYSTSTTYYYSVDNVITPDLIINWITFIPGGGIVPPPTIFSHFNAVQTQTVDNITLTPYVPTYSLSVNNVVQIQTSDNTSLTQHYLLLVGDVSQLQTSDSITLFAHYVILVNDTTQTHVADNIILFAHYSLVINDSAQAQMSDGILLTQNYLLLVNNVSQLQTAENTVLAAHYIITVNATSQVQVADNIILTQHHVLTVQNATQPQTADSVILVTHLFGILNVLSSTQAQTSDTVNLTQHHVLAIHNATQLQVVDNTVVVPIFVITTVYDSVHAQIAEQVTLTAHYSIMVNDATQIQTADIVALTQHYILSINNATQLQTTPTIGIGSHYLITTVYDSVHAQTAENVILTAHYGIIVDGSTHVQTSESVDLTQHHVLAINDVVQLQTVDNVTTTSHYIITTVNDAIHLQNADNIIVVFHNVLAIDNAIHLQTTDDIILFAHYGLTINNITHLQTADTITTLSHYVLGMVNDTTHAQTASLVVLIAALVLTFVTTPGYRVFFVEPEDRNIYNDYEDRNLYIEFEDRNYYIEHEDRVYDVLRCTDGGG